VTIEAVALGLGFRGSGSGVLWPADLEGGRCVWGVGGQRTGAGGLAGSGGEAAR
jgi:hypothetical protein